jgi:hypothetical protein
MVSTTRNRKKFVTPTIRAVVATAATFGAVTITTTTPALAAGSYSAASVSGIENTWGAVEDLPNPDMAVDAAQSMCVSKGGTVCQNILLPKANGDTCVAFVVLEGISGYWTGSGKSRDAAVADLARVLKMPTSDLKSEVVCASGVPRMSAPIRGGILPPTPDSRPLPPEALPAPDVTAVPVGGQVKVTVKEKAGVAADCVYTATPQPGNPFATTPDTHKFHLDANENETFNRPDSPVIPPGATWDIVVNCGQRPEGRTTVDF